MEKINRFINKRRRSKDRANQRIRSESRNIPHWPSYTEPSPSNQPANLNRVDIRADLPQGPHYTTPSSLSQPINWAGGNKQTIRATSLIGLASMAGLDNSDVEDLVRNDRAEPIATSSNAVSLFQPPNTLDLLLGKVALVNKPASEFDNFYTPKNKEFYSRSPYMILDSRRREVRLLRVILQKTNYSSHHAANSHWKRIENLYISGILIATELMDKVPLSSIDGRYCVLSYCAGDPTDAKTILVDGMPFNAFANLEHALNLALKYWISHNPQKDFLLWVDQVCINQCDQMERESQVAMMRDIYRRSNEVLVCLSTSESVETCFSWIPKSEKNNNGQYARVDELKDIVRKKLEVRDIKGSKSPAILADEPFDTLFLQLQNFVKRPWWSRAWVYQEFMAAPRASFLSGSEWISWVELYPLLQFLCHGMNIYLQEQLDGHTQGSYMWDNGSIITRFSRLISCLKSLDMSIISSMMDGKVNFRRPADLKDVLRHARHCQASDLRDRIYAFVSMADGGYSITPNYKSDNTVVHVLVDAAVKIIKYEANLSLLSHVADGRSSLAVYLPSWVPDWTSNKGETATQLREYIKRQREKANQNTSTFQVFPVSKALPMLVEFRKENSNETILDMKVMGIKITELDELETESVEGLSDLRSYLTKQNFLAVTFKSSLIDDEVWALHGANMPVVLRPVNDGTYSFLGEAVLTDQTTGCFSNAMFGSIAERINSGMLELKEIWLV